MKKTFLAVIAMFLSIGCISANAKDNSYIAACKSDPGIRGGLAALHGEKQIDKLVNGFCSCKYAVQLKEGVSAIDVAKILDKQYGLADPQMRKFAANEVVAKTTCINAGKFEEKQVSIKSLPAETNEALSIKGINIGMTKEQLFDIFPQSVGLGTLNQKDTIPWIDADIFIFLGQDKLLSCQFYSEAEEREAYLNNKLDEQRKRFVIKYEDRIPTLRDNRQEYNQLLAEFRASPEEIKIGQEVPPPFSCNKLSLLEKVPSSASFIFIDNKLVLFIAEFDSSSGKESRSMSRANSGDHTYDEIKSALSDKFKVRPSDAVSSVVVSNPNTGGTFEASVTKCVWRNNSRNENITLIDQYKYDDYKIRIILQSNDFDDVRLKRKNIFDAAKAKAELEASKAADEAAKKRSADL